MKHLNILYYEIFIRLVLQYTGKYIKQKIMYIIEVSI
jgi:hypothetical protein